MKTKLAKKKKKKKRKKRKKRGVVSANSPDRILPFYICYHSKSIPFTFCFASIVRVRSGVRFLCIIFYCFLIFKIVNIEKKKLKLCLNGLKNLRQNEKKLNKT
jgi:hypothetical protein